ncbi:P-loop NTPase family protein [Pseudomonas graminis]|uniref:hypothetical protein n=1 Tax=Pseudomonas graminis TaxID=158627 RepID=UPI0011146612
MTALVCVKFWCGRRVLLIPGGALETLNSSLDSALLGWREALITHVDLIVFAVTPTPFRLARLAAGERERVGDRITPRGDMHEMHVAFRKWASQYDDPDI